MKTSSVSTALDDEHNGSGPRTQASHGANDLFRRTSFGPRRRPRGRGMLSGHGKGAAIDINIVAIDSSCWERGSRALCMGRRQTYVFARGIERESGYVGACIAKQIFLPKTGYVPCVGGGRLFDA
ncbi:hypothetical protein EVAR_38989_1 [Eumeta japonica]|uniref:Uncharacterized protein n=1 Tax=Eumeta variegata TaxID=151549 RepID=A0A4C1WB63_EUMVA|nr:hypothetical protein EVAR_38989_1 [Eumeta japonica]